MVGEGDWNDAINSQVVGDELGDCGIEFWVMRAWGGGGL